MLIEVRISAWFGLVFLYQVLRWEAIIYMDAYEVTTVSTLSLNDFVNDLIDNFRWLALSIDTLRIL